MVFQTTRILPFSVRAVVKINSRVLLLYIFLTRFAPNEYKPVYLTEYCVDKAIKTDRDTNLEKLQNDKKERVWNCLHHQFTGFCARL